MADNKSGSGGMGRSPEGEGLSHKRSGGGGRGRKGERRPAESESPGRKPGEMDAPNIPENVKPNFE